MRKKILKMLYRSLDSPLGKRDGERLDRALMSDAGLRQLRDDLLALRRDIADSGTRSFRPRSSRESRRTSRGGPRRRPTGDRAGRRPVRGTARADREGRVSRECSGPVNPEDRRARDECPLPRRGSGMKKSGSRGMNRGSPVSH